MKNKINLILVIFFLCVAIQGNYSQNDSQYKFILDYNVPESPAFTMLNLNPNKVQTGSASKPLVINLLNQFILGQKVTPGLAIDFSPFVFGVKLNNIKEYREKPFLRILINSLISIATVKNSSDSNSLDFGLGLRSTLFDDHDLFENSNLRDKIDNMLMNQANASTTIDTTRNEIGKPIEIKDMKVVYENFKKQLEEQPGNSLSFGIGLSGTLKGSYIKTDSVDLKKYGLWIAYTRYMSFINLYCTLQGSYFHKNVPSNFIGVGIKTKNLYTALGGEFVYDFTKKKIDGGLSGSMKIYSGFNIIVGVHIENTLVNQEYFPHLIFNTNFKWNMGN